MVDEMTCEHTVPGACRHRSLSVSSRLSTLLSWSGYSWSCGCVKRRVLYGREFLFQIEEVTTVPAKQEVLP